MVCVKWFPHSLMVKHNTESKAISSVLLAHSEADREALSWIVTADKTLVHCFEPETKKSTHGMALSSIFLKEKIQYLCQWSGHGHCFLGL